MRCFLHCCFIIFFINNHITIFIIIIIIIIIIIQIIDLQDYDQERAGRIKKSKDKPPSSTLKRASSNLSYTSTVPEIHNKTESLRSQNIDDSLMMSPPGSCVSYSSEIQKTVGLLVIGDEILKGNTQDVNTQAAAVALRRHNVHLKRVVVISDNQDEIVHEIQRLEAEVDCIITSGGVGPTHDDVTLKSVATAMNHDMVLHDEMVKLLRDKMNDGEDADLTEAQLKMATLPSNAKLRYLSKNDTDWPVLQCRNVFILPGVPEFFSKKIENVASYLSCQLERSVACKLVLSVDETSIVSILNAVVGRHPNVSIGSYPFVSHPELKTVLTIEGRMLVNHERSNSLVMSREAMTDSFSKEQMDQHVRLALDDLIHTLPEGSILRVDNDDQLTFS